MGRFAILLDGAFVVRRLRGGRLRSGKEGGESTASVDVTQLNASVERIRAHERLKGHELLRVYFYDAPPQSGRTPNPLGGSPYDFDNALSRQNQKFHDQIKSQADFALRLGETVLRGWKLRQEILEQSPPLDRKLEPKDISPNVEQKGVDLRIGLDMAALAFKRIADIIVLVTGDSDLVPAMKLVRREGLRVYLDCMGNHARPGLIEHADFVFEDDMHPVRRRADLASPAPVTPSR